MKHKHAQCRILRIKMKAFPKSNHQFFDAQEGMDLRDYFAAKAMQAIQQTSKSTMYSDVARHAYKMADAMMKAREE